MSGKKRKKKENGKPQLRTCPECGSHRLLRDYEVAEIVCMNCGMVVATKIGPVRAHRRGVVSIITTTPPYADPNVEKVLKQLEESFRKANAGFRGSLMGKCGNGNKLSQTIPANFKKVVNVKNLGEKGMLQYFYHSPLSILPIRDVTNELGKGHKTEPHIEIGAENYLEDCYQSNIRRFLLSDAKYLFLVTTCRNKQLRSHYGIQYIVGCITKQGWGTGSGKRKNSVFVKGEVKLFPFDNAIPSRDLFGKNLDRAGIMQNLFVNSGKTEKILQHLNDHSIPLEKYVREIDRLDRSGRTCYHGKKCEYRNECLRFG